MQKMPPAAKNINCVGAGVKVSRWKEKNFDWQHLI